MRVARRVVLFLVLLGCLASPHATRIASGDALQQAIVVESYVGARPAAAEKIMTPLRAQLQERGYVADPTVLAMRLEDRAARPGLVDESLTINALSQMFENGIRAWNSGDEEAAVIKLDAAISTALRNPSLLSSVSRLRDQLYHSYLALALAQRRRGLGPASEASMGELIRTFPDRPIELDEVGPEAHELYRFVLADLSKSKHGALSVEVSDPTSVVFVNEVPRRDGSGDLDLQGMLPGTYRVLVRSLEVSDRVRVYSVPVYPSQRTTLKVDWELDSVLVVEKWVGFRFGTSVEQTSEPALARKLGVNARAFLVVTLNLTRVRNSYRLEAKRYETRTGNLLAWCQVDLAGPDRRAFSLLTECVSGEFNRARHALPTPTQVARSRFFGSLKVEPFEPPAVEIHRAKPAARAEPKSTGGVGKWVWGAVGMAALAAGGTLLYLDGRSSCDGPSYDCAAYNTRMAGLVVLGGGGVAVGISTFLFVTELEAVPQPVSTGSSHKSWVAGVSVQW